MNKVLLTILLVVFMLFMFWMFANTDTPEMCKSDIMKYQRVCIGWTVQPGE